MSPNGQDSKRRIDPGTTIALLRRFWAIARVHRSWFLLGLSMIPIVTAMTILRPRLGKYAVDVTIPAHDFVSLRLVGIGFLVAVMTEFIGQAVQVYALQRGGHATISDLRHKVFSHVLRLPASYYDSNAIGSLLSRTTSDVEALSETLSFGVFTILSDAIMIIAIVVAMFLLNPTLTLLTLLVAPVLVLIVGYFGRTLRRLQLEIRKAQAAQTGFLAEQLTGVTIVQLFGRQKVAHAQYDRLGQRYLGATKRANILDSLLYSVMDGISAFSIALLLYFAAPSTLQGGPVTLGLLFAFVDYLQRLFIPIKEFSGKLATIQRATASLERIFSLLDEPIEARSDSAADPLSTWRGQLRVRDLRFAYKPTGPDVLKGISFDVAPGEIVAIVGRTGSGKSSLGRLLGQFYTGYRGHIDLIAPEFVTELSSLTPDQLRRHVLMVQQDVFLFDDDIGFNVSLGSTAIGHSRERVEHALGIVQADHLARQRGGTEFQVGERGSNLSAGEAQLVAFARVAARQPTLLILDEATASVDSLTEHKVQVAIEELLHGRSVIVIAHRLSTVRRADKILVMSAGQIAEQGRHDELLALGGIYADLYRTGFRDDADDEVAQDRTDDASTPIEQDVMSVPARINDMSTDATP